MTVIVAYALILTVILALVLYPFIDMVLAYRAASQATDETFDLTGFEETKCPYEGLDEDASLEMLCYGFAVVFCLRVMGHRDPEGAARTHDWTIACAFHDMSAQDCADLIIHTEAANAA